MNKAIVDFARHGLKILSDKYGGDCTLNEVRVIVQIVRCHLDGRTCSVTALHRVTGIPVPTVSRAVASLQGEGWLTDQPDPTDGRRRIISLGPRAVETTPGDLETSVEWIDVFFRNGLSKANPAKGEGCCAD